jgi:hypothetical protein
MRCAACMIIPALPFTKTNECLLAQDAIQCRALPLPGSRSRIMAKSKAGPVAFAHPIGEFIDAEMVAKW